MSKNVKASLNMSSLDRGRFSIRDCQHQVRVIEGWNTEKKDGGLVNTAETELGYSVKMRSAKNRDGEVITDRFVVTKKDELVRRMAPERLVVLTDLGDNNSIVIKAYRVFRHRSREPADLKLERDILWKCNPEDKGVGIQEKGNIEFEYKGYRYIGIEFKREQKIPLSEVIEKLASQVDEGRLSRKEALRIFLVLFKKVLASYRDLSVKTAFGEEHVYATDIGPGNVLLSPECMVNPEAAEVKPIDYPHHVRAGYMYGSKWWRTYRSESDEALFAKNPAKSDKESFQVNLYAKTAQIMFCAFQEILRDGVQRIGDKSAGLNEYRRNFRPDLVIDKSRSWESVDAMFGFYEALLDEMLAANNQAVVVNKDPLKDNLVAKYITKKLQTMHQNLDYILSCADKADPAYTALRQYRDRSKKIPTTASGFQQALDDASCAMAEMKRLQEEKAFHHRNHVERRAGGKLALSKNKGIIIGLAFGIILGGIIPALIALIVLSVLENQQTARAQQVSVLLNLWKKIEGSLSVRREPTLSFGVGRGRRPPSLMAGSSDRSSCRLPPKSLTR